MLYPQQNAFRSVTDLSGFWRFVPDPDDRGHDEKWYDRPLPEGAMTIAVPGAWNEQLAERGLFNYVGRGWYEIDLDLPRVLVNRRRVALHVAAADHHAEVWLNGSYVGEHRGGYLPFEIDLTDAWTTRQPNRLTLCVDSRLTMETIPQDVDPRQPPYNEPAYERRHLYPPTRFDFFPYGGLTRAVRLTTSPADRLETIRIASRLSGEVTIRVEALSETAKRIAVELVDGDAQQVAAAEATFTEGAVGIDAHIPDVRPWSPADPHLYRAVVRLLDGEGNELDRYTETFGIREVSVDGGTLMLNGEPLFLSGFGKHEDFPIVGRGKVESFYLRDFELMRWIGANSFRTSHYPYDEEIIRLADRLGFLVIDEVPAVSLGFWSDSLEDMRGLMDNHKNSLTELIARDASRPSVIAWSIVNEANLWSEKHYQNDASRQYFREVYEHVKGLDTSRPVISVAIPAFGEHDVALDACDVIGINRYYAWYTDPADLALARSKLDAELDRIYERHGKPIIVTEFGADTVEGYHATTAQLFTEEFQAALIETYAEVIRSKPFCAGEHIWNFADFRTPQHFRRVVLNKKGVFTRMRDPKRAAFWLRGHWTQHDRIRDSHRPPLSGGDGLVPDLKPAP